MCITTLALSCNNTSPISPVTLNFSFSFRLHIFSYLPPLPLGWSNTGLAKVPLPRAHRSIPFPPRAALLCTIVDRFVDITASYDSVDCVVYLGTAYWALIKCKTEHWLQKSRLSVACSIVAHGLK